MKKHIVTAALSLLLLNLNAQTKGKIYSYIGIKGGISIPNLTAAGEQNEISEGYSSKTGPNFAVFFEREITKRFSLSTQLEYAAQGGKKDGFQAFPIPDEYAAFFPPGQAPTYLYADFNSEVRINYLMLCQLARFSFPISQSRFSFYVEAGLFVGLLLSAHQNVTGSSIIYADKEHQIPLTPIAVSLDSTQNIKDQLHNGNFGFEGHIGLAYKTGNGKVFIEGGGNYGFLNIQKGTENGKNHIGAGTVRVGYALGF